MRRSRSAQTASGCKNGPVDANSTPEFLAELDRVVARFSSERDWAQFHNPKNLVLALTGELGELAEVFQWLTPDESLAVRDPSNPLHADAAAEVADVLIYLIRLGQVLDIDLVASGLDKMVANEEKYPVDRSRGIAGKPDAAVHQRKDSVGQPEQPDPSEKQDET